MDLYGIQIDFLSIYYAIIIPIIFLLIFLLYRRKQYLNLKSTQIILNDNLSRSKNSINKNKSQNQIFDINKYHDIDLKIEKLIKICWPNKDKTEGINFHYVESNMDGFNIEEYISKLLKHVQCTCPKLTVPQMVPKVKIDNLKFSAGEFMEDDGWIKITIGSDFLLNIAASKAILCHELCHYILNSNGIREKSTIENEKLTDIAMFVFGIGAIFLKGYRTAPINEYRLGHRLGYLTDDEYYYTIGKIDALWQSGNLQKNSLDELEKLLKASIIDPKSRERLIRNAKKKYPTKSQGEIIQYVLESYIKDRR